MNVTMIYAQAHDAGNVAVSQATVTPMIVQQRANPLDDNSDTINQWFVDDGVCGFASVIVKPSNSKFANFLKVNGLGRKHYYGGIIMPMRADNIVSVPAWCSRAKTLDAVTA